MDINTTGSTYSQELARCRMRRFAEMQSTAKPTTDSERAIEWAESKGYPVPTQNGSGLGWACAYGAGIVLGGFPVLIVACVHLNQTKQNQRDMDALTIRWIDAGRPEPQESN